MKTIIGNNGSFFPEDRVPSVAVKVYDDNNKLLSDMTFEPHELSRLYRGKDGGIPQPIKGGYPKETYKLIWETPVPYGTRDLFKNLFDKFA
mgnify:CR=1 FL=1